MARTAREKSITGIYHVMLRGINKQDIFAEADDYDYMLRLLTESQKHADIVLYGYCLMTNHVHILIHEGKEPLEVTMRRIAGKYATHFNLKYERSGHLFQDRYKSEAVNEDDYFLIVLRYIHMNPVCAGMVKAPEDYKYSSYTSYFGEQNIAVADKAFSMMGKKEFLAFHWVEYNDNCLDITTETNVRLTEERAKETMTSLTNCLSSADFQKLSQKERIYYIAEMKARGLSIRQINRLTGETIHTIRNAK